jgi:hypothetical protein
MEGAGTAWAGGFGASTDVGSGQAAAFGGGGDDGRSELTQEQKETIKKKLMLALRKQMLENTKDAFRCTDDPDRLQGLLEKPMAWAVCDPLCIMRIGWKEAINSARNLANTFALVGTLLFALVIPQAWSTIEAAEGPTCFGWDRNALIVPYYVLMAIAIVGSMALTLTSVFFAITIDITNGCGIYDADNFMLISKLSVTLPQIYLLCISVGILPGVFVAALIVMPAAAAGAFLITGLIALVTCTVLFMPVLVKMRDLQKGAFMFEANTGINIKDVVKEAMLDES